MLHRLVESTIDCGQGWGASTGTAANNQLVFKQKRFRDDGADAAGTREFGQGDDQLRREKKQVTHRQGRLPWTRFSARLRIYGVSRYDWRIRTPHVELQIMNGSAVCNIPPVRRHARSTPVISSPRIIARGPFLTGDVSKRHFGVAHPGSLQKCRDSLHVR